MAEEKEGSWVFGILVIGLLALLACLGTLSIVENRYQTGCEERCHPFQMATMTPATGCICAEAK